MLVGSVVPRIKTAGQAGLPVSGKSVRHRLNIHEIFSIKVVMVLKKREVNKKKREKDTSYQDDEEFRNLHKKRSRERYHKDLNYKKATLERARRRYYDDAEYREATIRRARERYHRLKKLK